MTLRPTTIRSIAVPGGCSDTPYTASICEIPAISTRARAFRCDQARIRCLGSPNGSPHFGCNQSTVDLVRPFHFLLGSFKEEGTDATIPRNLRILVRDPQAALRIIAHKGSLVNIPQPACFLVQVKPSGLRNPTVRAAAFYPSPAGFCHRSSASAARQGEGLLQRLPHPRKPARSLGHD
jgi:hypothetical protein